MLEAPPLQAVTDTVSNCPIIEISRITHARAPRTTTGGKHAAAGKGEKGAGHACCVRNHAAGGKGTELHTESRSHFSLRPMCPRRERREGYTPRQHSHRMEGVARAAAAAAVAAPAACCC